MEHLDFSRFQLALSCDLGELKPPGIRGFYKALDRMHIPYAYEAVEVTLLVDLTPEHLKSASEVLAFSEADSLVVLMSIAALRLNSTTPPTWMMVMGRTG